MRRVRTVTVARPDERGELEGLSYSLWLPARARAGVAILHGAGSCKESQYDFARAAFAHDLAALCFDMRGHGESGGRLDGRAIADVAKVAALMRERIGDPRARIALRGSSMGGYLAVVAAEQARAAAIVAICPAPERLLLAALRRGELDLQVARPALEALLGEHELAAAACALDLPVLLLHAAGDERVPVESSRELAVRLRSPASRLVEVPGGHHRSVQHDPELQALSLRFLQAHLGQASDLGRA